MSGPDQGWTVARGRRARKPGPREQAVSCSGAGQAPGTPAHNVDAAVTACLGQIQSCREVLRCSAFLSGLVRQLSSTPWPGDGGGASVLQGASHLAILGLGSLDRPHVRHQLALGLELRAALPGLLGVPYVSDPAFTPIDAAVCARLGFQVRGVWRRWGSMVRR